MSLAKKFLLAGAVTFGIYFFYATVDRALARTAVPDNSQLEITVTAITRVSSDGIEIRYALKNKGRVDLYLPYFQIAGSPQLTTYSLSHRRSGGAWTNVGPSYDVASYEAKVLQPGAMLSLVQLMSDSATQTPAGTGGALSGWSTDVQGCYRIRVGYYSGAAAWQQRLNTMKEQQQSRKTLRMPPMGFAYSEQFEL